MNTEYNNTVDKYFLPFISCYFNKKYLYLYLLIRPEGRVFANNPEDWGFNLRSRHTKDFKNSTWYLLVYFSGGARGVMIIVVGNGHGDTSSHSTNILGKGMNPIILPPAMGK